MTPRVMPPSVALIFVAFAFNLLSCALQPRGKKGDDSNPSSADATSKKDPKEDNKEGSSLSSQEAFEQTVHKLVREVTCKGCHGSVTSPFFAAEDATQAHAEIIDAKKVDLLDAKNSRIYIQLVENQHQCWTSDCEADAETMLAAIQQWIDLMKTSESDGTTNPRSETESLSLSDAVTVQANLGANTIVLQAESATLRAPMAAATDANAMNNQYLTTPVGNGQILQANSNAAGTARFNITIKQDGVYRVWGRVNAPNANQNSFYLRFDATAARVWDLPVTNTAWQWQLVADQAVNGNAQQFSLTAGAHTLEVRQRKGGTRIDALVITDNTALQGNDVQRGPAKVLRYDLSDLLQGENATLEIEVDQYDDFSFIFRDPRIVAASAKIKVKGMHVLLNGNGDPQNATYSKVDMIITPQSGGISSAALIMPFDTGFDSDAISIAFDELKVIP